MNTISCRSCGSAIRRLEVIADGGGGIYLRPTDRVLESLDEFDSTDPRWLALSQGRYLDGYACLSCKTADLAVVDLKAVLDQEGNGLPISSRHCPACNECCCGPLLLEIDAVPAGPMAFIEPKYGAGLCAWLCPSCGRVLLGLQPADSTGRSELASRFPDVGECSSCIRGRLRLTQVDAPYCGFVWLTEPSLNESPAPKMAELMVAICDACGEATTQLRVKKSRRK